MKRVKTFNIRVPKGTRSREIPDEKKERYKSPLVSNPVRHLDFKISELSSDIQVRKLENQIEKEKRHIRNLIQRKARFPSESLDLERKIRKAEGLTTKWQIQIVLLERQRDISQKKAQTKIDNEIKADKIRKEVIEGRHARFFRADPRKTTVHVEGETKEFFTPKVGEGNVHFKKEEIHTYEKQKIVDRKVRVRREKRWSQK